MRTVEKNPVAPCPRCGIPRTIRTDRRPGLCRDCTYVLTKAEWERWVA